MTCISFIDAEAYCKWANLRLPTIEEWEIASIKEGIDRRYYFGDSLDVIYEHANIWHGKTHLMKAISAKLTIERPSLRIRYLSAEQFTNEMVQAFRFRNTTNFHKMSELVLSEPLQ